MKGARIVLLLSPLLLFIPSLFPHDKSVGLSMVGMFYSELLTYFPWNLVYAVICYLYCQRLGRDPYGWILGASMFPFATPLVLAFMSPKDGSVADVAKRMAAKPGKAAAAAGAFSERFQLLERHLEGQSEQTAQAARAQFMTVPSNCEFILPANGSMVAAFSSAAVLRKITLFAPEAVPTPAVVPIYGAGLVAPDKHEEFANWLLKHCSSGGKLVIAWHGGDCGVQFSEFYSA